MLKSKTGEGHDHNSLCQNVLLDNEITYAKYSKTGRDHDHDSETEMICAIECIINGEHWSVPLSPSNRHYNILMEWVKQGNTIEGTN